MAQYYTFAQNVCASNTTMEQAYHFQYFTIFYFSCTCQMSPTSIFCISHEIKILDLIS